MIRARWEAPCRLTVAGHAAYAPPGRDIVCAGASTLWGTLVEALTAEEEAGHGTLRLWEEPCRAAFYPCPGREAEIRRIYALIWRGLTLLSRHYPAYIAAERDF